MRLEHLLESVLRLILGREDERDGLLAAVTRPDGGQELLEEGTPGCDLQSGGGGDQTGPPIDADVVETGHDGGREVERRDERARGEEGPLSACRCKYPELS